METNVLSEYFKRYEIDLKPEHKIVIMEYDTNEKRTCTLKLYIVSIGSHSKSMNIIGTKLDKGILLEKNDHINVDPQEAAIKIYMNLVTERELIE